MLGAVDDPKDGPFPEKRGPTFEVHASVVQRAMFDSWIKAAARPVPIRPIQGSTFAARPPVWVRTMRDLADHADDRGPIGSGSTLPSRQRSRCKKPSRWTGTMGCEQAEKEQSQGEVVTETVEPVVGAAGRLSPAMGLSPSLTGSLICTLPLYLSSPSQNLNLRPSSTWLCGAENDLRSWPPGAGSACICGH